MLKLIYKLGRKKKKKSFEIKKKTVNKNHFIYVENSFKVVFKLEQSPPKGIVLFFTIQTSPLAKSLDLHRLSQNLQTIRGCACLSTHFSQFPNNLQAFEEAIGVLVATVVVCWET